MPIVEFEPMTRESMRSLKAIRDEEDRIRGIKAIVERIYVSAKLSAKTTENTAFYYPIPLTGFCPFHIKNMTAILEELRRLFPGLSVEKMVVGESSDKRLHIITNENAHLRYKELNFFQDYIVVDWT